MEILEIVRARLSDAGYHVRFGGSERGSLYFEDSSLYGFVRVCKDVAEINAEWQSAQDEFLTSNARSLKRSPEKAWNAYCIFLTEKECPDELHGSLIEIEEDLRGARKIARAGVDTRDEIDDALAPLLPLRKAARVDLQEVEERLLSGGAITPRLLEMLTSNATEEEIAQMLMEEE